MSAGTLLIIAGVWVGCQLLGGQALRRLKLIGGPDLAGQALSDSLGQSLTGPSVGNPIGLGLPVPNLAN